MPAEKYRRAARELRAMAPRLNAKPTMYDVAVDSAVQMPESTLKEAIFIHRKEAGKLRRLNKRDDTRWWDSSIAIHDMAMRVAEAELNRRKQPRKKTRSFKARG